MAGLTRRSFEAAYEAVQSYGGYVDADIVDSEADLDGLLGVSVEATQDVRSRGLVYREYFSDDAPDEACGIYAKCAIAGGQLWTGGVWRTYRRPNVDGGEYHYTRDNTTRDIGYEAAWKLVGSALGKLMLLPELSSSRR